MKFHRSYFFSLCAIATLGLLGCDEEDPNVKTCHATSECGSAEDWKCNIETNTCEELNPAHCKNQRKDDNETDIDCGGACGYKCENNKICAENKDCKSAYCSDKNLCATKPCTSDLDCTAADPTSVCLFPETGDVSYGTCVSCSDGQKNGSETDVDCGGTCATLCDQGKSCSTNSDCITAQCTSGVCTGEIPNAPTASDLVINEVLPAANKTSSFANFESDGSCDFVEIVNVGTKPVSLEGVKLVVQRTDKEEKAAEYDLKGVLAPKQAAVVNACSGNPFPADVLNIPHEKLDFTNSALSYSMTLKLGETQLTSASYTIEKEQKTVSLNLAKDLDPNSGFVRHNTISELNNTPGRCSNNQPFSTGCIDSCSNNVKDNDESDIDCGGSCNTKCANGKTCNSGDDCLTGTCTGGTCSGDVPNEPTASDLVINEVLPAANKKSSFETIGSGKSCDFAEIVNIGTNPVSLANVTLVVQRTDVEKAPVPFALTGVLAPKQAAVIHACAESPFSGSEDFLTIFNEKFDLTNSGLSYTLSLKLGETHLTSVNYTIDKEHSAKSLNLNPDLNISNPTLTYHNELSNLSHSPGLCTNGASFAADCKLTCDNTIKDGNESDVNCGGSCAPCELGKTCNSENDCASGYCNNNGKCDVAPCSSNDDCEEGQVCTAGACVDPCTNGTKDGDESDTDCGGTVCSKCGTNKACATDDDCLSGTCNNNKCTEPSPKATVRELVINEVMAAPKSSAMFETASSVTQCEYIELVNTTNETLDVSALSIVLCKDCTTVEDTTSVDLTKLPLAGNVSGKSPFLYHNCATTDFNAENLTLQTGKSSLITNNKPYIIWLEDAAGNASSMILFEKADLKQEYSGNLAKDLDMTMDGDFVPAVLHTDAENAATKHSPGLCANGKQFINDCK